MALVKVVPPRVSYADLERMPEIELYELSNGAYALRASATGDDEVRSATLPGHTFIARSVFP